MYAGRCNTTFLADIVMSLGSGEVVQKVGVGVVWRLWGTQGLVACSGLL